MHKACVLFPQKQHLRAAPQARDEARNRRLCGGDVFAVRLEGPRSVAGAVEDGGDGAYTATYCTQAAGQYTLHITNGACLGHPDVPHSPK